MRLLCFFIAVRIASKLRHVEGMPPMAVRAMLVVFASFWCTRASCSSFSGWKCCEAFAAASCSALGAFAAFKSAKRFLHQLCRQPSQLVRF
jgi:hypothetical protein